MLRHGGISDGRVGGTFRNHNFLQSVALHQKFFLPFLSTEIILFLDIDNCSVDTWDSLPGISGQRRQPGVCHRRSP